MTAHAAAQVTFHESDACQGRSCTTTGEVTRLDRGGFNDRASSVVVRGERTARREVCENRRLRGRCVLLRPGPYPSQQAMGLDHRASSVRSVAGDERVDERRCAPAPPIVRDHRRRDSEPLYQAEITSVRAVVDDAGRGGQPSETTQDVQRCSEATRAARPA